MASNVRRDPLQKATVFLTKTKSVICMDDLNMSGTFKNHHLAGTLTDVSLAEFFRELNYKDA